MPIKCTLRGSLLLAILAATSACSSLPSTPRDLLDERSGVTVSVVGAPIEFAHDANGEPPHEGPAHDVLTLVAIQRDDDGKYTSLILLYRWSIHFSVVPPAPEADTGELLITADGHAIDLRPLPRLPAGLP